METCLRFPFYTFLPSPIFTFSLTQASLLFPTFPSYVPFFQMLPSLISYPMVIFHCLSMAVFYLPSHFVITAVFPTVVLHPTLTAKCTLKHSHILASVIYGTRQIKYLKARKTAIMKGIKRRKVAGFIFVFARRWIMHVVAQTAEKWKFETWRVLALSDLLWCVYSDDLASKSTALSSEMCNNLSILSYKCVFGSTLSLSVCLLFFTQQINMHDWDYDIWWIFP